MANHYYMMMFIYVFFFFAVLLFKLEYYSAWLSLFHYLNLYNIVVFFLQLVQIVLLELNRRAGHDKEKLLLYDIVFSVYNIVTNNIKKRSKVYEYLLLMCC